MRHRHRVAAVPRSRMRGGRRGTGQADDHAADVLAVASGSTAVDGRPSPERGAEDDGWGARCGLGDAGFAAWTCRAGFKCVRESESDVGVCVPQGGAVVGDACETGLVNATSSSHADGARLTTGACATNQVCETNAVGFPGGMCSGACGAEAPGAVCGGIPVLTEFNACLAAGASFNRCIADNTRPGTLHACGFHEPCRDDYVCARSGDHGACMPPYFLFQLRVDGHPI